jgi:hypothetical protein
MVAMFHLIVGKFPDGRLERHTSRLLDFGDVERFGQGNSAMSKTVGFTTGAAAELLLYGPSYSDRTKHGKRRCSFTDTCS